MQNSNTLVPTILCGGAGSRLWPVSRALHPKPFMRLSGGRSLLQMAFLRGAVLPGVEQVLTVTNHELVFKTRGDLAEVDSRSLASAYILEPFGRGTAAAVACAAVRVAQLHGEAAQLLVLPADHVIADEAAFGQAVARARVLAQGGRLVTFGIKPDAPETGYGYIESQGEDVLRFVEKPSPDTARSYVASGRYLWNSGMFCFAAGTLLREMERHCAPLLAAVRECMERSAPGAGATASQLALDPDTFSLVPDNSIDYALMEKSDRVAVVPCSIGWSDVGSWSAISDMALTDGNSNQIEADAVLHDVKGCYIRSAERVVGAVGVENLLIIDTPDALLVASKSHAQDVKHIFAQLKAKDHDAHKLHRTVHRPWGTYTVLEEGPGFKIKRIEVKPGERLSLQMHHHRSEHWIVVSGTAKVTNGEREITINTNESTFIPAGNRHRLENATRDELVIIEVQSGPYLGEDDIVRFDDQYGRVPAASV